MGVKVNAKNFEERIAFNLATKISNHMQADNLYFVKMKYGLEVLIINLTKMFFILMMAQVLGILKGTVIMILCFAFIRCYAFGVHAKSSINCTIITSVSFFSGSYISKVINITNYEVLFMFFIILTLLYLYAPADTEERPLVGKKFRETLRKKALLSGSILMILALCINDSSLKFFISYGALCESLTITPIIYKLFNRRYKNYEHYKKNIN